MGGWFNRESRRMRTRLTKKSTINNLTYIRPPNVLDNVMIGAISRCLWLLQFHDAPIRGIQVGRGIVMSTPIWAYQIIPGSDELLFYAVSEQLCRETAMRQRADIMSILSEDVERLAPMTLYRVELRSITVAEVIGVLNGDVALSEACTLNRIAVGQVGD